MPEPTAVAKYRRGEWLHFCSRDRWDEFAPCWLGKLLRDADHGLGQA